MQRSHLLDLFIVFFTPVFIGVCVFWFFFKRKEQIIFRFEVLPTQLRVHVFPFIWLSFNYDTFESLEIAPFGKSFSTIFRFNMRLMNEGIFIRRNRGLIREIFIGPNDVERFFKELNEAVSVFKTQDAKRTIQPS